MLELIQIKVHLFLISKKNAVNTSLSGVKVVYPGFQLYAIKVVLQRAVIVLKYSRERLLAEGSVDCEFDEEDAELEDEVLWGCLSERGG